jgi:hypothetical protein
MISIELLLDSLQKTTNTLNIKSDIYNFYYRGNYYVITSPNYQSK